MRLLAPIAIYGLRASEPCQLFYEHLSADWLDVPCLPELAYYTKGHRGKRLPVMAGLDTLLRPVAEARSSGLIYLCRGVVTDGRTAIPPPDCALRSSNGSVRTSR